jgi:hypothetical protein
MTDADLPTGEDWAGQDFSAHPRKSVQQLVMEDIAEREQYGITTFGTAIFPDTSDDPVEGGPVGQAYREALDLVIYLRWHMARMAQTKIVTLCGSTRFAAIFRKLNLQHTVAGDIVLSIGCDSHSDEDLANLADLGFDINEVKPRLDELHRRKIDISDGIVVVSDETGYIGNSTRGEIDYAIAHGKHVSWYYDAARRNYLKGGGTNTLQEGTSEQ